MWARRSHTSAPLTRLTSIKRKYKWTQFKQDAFEKIKWIVSRDTYSTDPDFNETFKIHTDASAFQLGEIISQKDKPIAFYSRKLTDSQQRYILTERELLSIVETLKKSIMILPGQILIIYTDHKNLTCKLLNTD